MTESSNENGSTADAGGSDFEELERIFDLVSAEPQDRRLQVLERICPNPELRNQIRELLDADGQTDLLLDHSLVPKANKLSPGDLVGPYELIEEIGHGGMGVVYMAQQLEPIRRKVALKVIKPGVDTRQVIARFEAERQALSVMNHPNIARVLDAGQTDSGRPYFVMELVQGKPITDYCDQKQLNARQRLELFVSVCNAIQHAHQKGIIHRDIKPSNVLVAEYDRGPAAKVIDFGVAKAIDQALSELTVFTGFGQIVGTFEYMSPEQSQLNQPDIDTRSDIYSLGVLLYELLTGSPPFDRKKLRSLAWDEMLRIIREEDPPKPSVRVSEVTQPMGKPRGDRESPSKLKRVVKRELDWIVMKAMEKDRSRRYDTANAFAEDIERFLSGNAVAACPPSRSYQFRKFAARNKVALATTMLVATSLVLGLIGTTVSSIRARRAEEETRAFSSFVVDDFLGATRAESQVLAGLRPDAELKHITFLDRARASVDKRYSDRPEVQARIKATLGACYQSIRRFSDAAPLYADALAFLSKNRGDTHADTLRVMRQLGRVYFEQGRIAEAEQILSEALPNSRLLPDPEQLTTRLILEDLGMVDYWKQQYQRAESRYNECLAIKRKHLGNAHPETLSTMSKLALTYEKQDRTKEAEALHMQVLDGLREVEEENSLGVPTALGYLGRYYLDRGRRTNDKALLTKAASLLREAGDVLRVFPGEGRPATLENQSWLAEVYCEQGEYEKAEALLTGMVKTNVKVEDVATAQTLNMLAWVYLRQKRLEEAYNLLADLVETVQEANFDKKLLLQVRDNYAVVNHRLGMLQSAIDEDRKALKLSKRLYGADHQKTLAIMARLGLSHIETGNTDEGTQLVESALTTAGR